MGDQPASGYRIADQAAEVAGLCQALYIGSVGLSPSEAEAKFRPNLALGWTEQDLAGKIDAAVKGSPAAVRRVFEESGNRDQVLLLTQLRCPTLLLRAEVARGGIVGDEAVAVAQANPLISVVTVPEAEHTIHRGRFEAFMREVEVFVDWPG